MLPHYNFAVEQLSSLSEKHYHCNVRWIAIPIMTYNNKSPLTHLP